MGRTCKGICVQYKSPKIPNGQKYLLGHKRCSFCELFISINGACSSAPEEPIPHLWEAPDFSLVNFDGRRITRSMLLGRVWVGAFIFTRCPGPCPLISQRMKAVQAELDPRETWLISFTVDPEFDTPAVLGRYGKQWSVNHDNWFFLTSERAEDLDEVAAGFKVAASRSPGENEEAPLDIVHGTHIFVVDQEGIVRAFVGSTSPDSVREIVGLVRRLEQE